MIEESQPELTSLFRAQSAIRKEIAAQLQADRPDWTRLSGLLAEDEANRLQIDARSSMIERRFLERLSAPDRLAFLRDKFGIGLKSPEIVFSPPSAVESPPGDAKGAKPPRPRGNPESWATPNDYPAAALAAKHQGVAGYRVRVGTDGRATECRIVRSSGSSELDKQACLLVERRARFVPGTDAAGMPIAGTYANEVRWTLPE